MKGLIIAAKIALAVSVLVGFVFGLRNIDRRGDERRLANIHAMRQALGGPHELRRLFEERTTHTEREGAIGGGFFVFVGGFAGSIRERTDTISLVKFAWRLRNGAYTISTIPVERVRVRLVDGASPPIVRFKWQVPDWRNSDISGYLPEEMVEHHIRYVEVTCRPEDWPSIPIRFMEPPQPARVANTQ